MSEFRMHTVESAPPSAQPLLQGLQEQVGFVPNLAATMADSPSLLQAFLGLRAAAREGSLDPVTREIVSIVVGTETGCGYCVAAHSTFALKLGASAGDVEAARSAAPLRDRRLQALAGFSRAVVRRQGDVSQRVRELVDAGLSPAQVLDVVVVIATGLLAGSAVQVASVALDRAFQPQAWDAIPCA